MADPFDFPATPTVGQRFTTPEGMVYQWDGTGWIIDYYDSETQQLQTVSDVIAQIRVLLQDVDYTPSSGYRYSTDSIVLCLNQGMIDLYRMRPDIFASLKFIIPQFNVGMMGESLGIELQYVSPLVFYVVGLVQARDDEQTQDARAAAFLQTFKGAVLTVS